MAITHPKIVAGQLVHNKIKTKEKEKGKNMNDQTNEKLDVEISEAKNREAFIENLLLSENKAANMLGKYHAAGLNEVLEEFIFLCIRDGYTSSQITHFLIQECLHNLCNLYLNTDFFENPEIVMNDEIQKISSLFSEGLKISFEQLSKSIK